MAMLLLSLPLIVLPQCRVPRRIRPFTPQTVWPFVVVLSLANQKHDTDAGLGVAEEESLGRISHSWL
jgi:hypothetical protein